MICKDRQIKLKQNKEKYFIYQYNNVFMKMDLLITTSMCFLMFEYDFDNDALQNHNFRQFSNVALAV